MTNLLGERCAQSSPVDDVTVVRTLHVLAVVLWIGGVAFVTTVLLPAVRDLHAPAERVVFFETIERRFGKQARVTTVLAGLSGFYMPVSSGIRWHLHKGSTGSARDSPTQLIG